VESLTEVVNNEKELRAFLLGECSEDARSKIEDRFLADEEFSAQLYVVEDELIESYLRSELTDADRKKFETAFLTSPRRRERVLAMKAVIQAANAEAAILGPAPALWASLTAFFSSHGRFIPYALAAGVLLILGVGVALWLNKRDSQSNGPVAQQSPVAIRPEATASATSTPSPLSSSPAPTPQSSPSPKIEAPPVGPTFASIVLHPTLTRDPGRANKLALPSSVQQVHLQLTLDSKEYRSYTVRITTVAGHLVWQRASVKTQKDFLVIHIPASLLTTDDYFVEVSGMGLSGPPESLASYFFSVSRK